MNFNEAGLVKSPLNYTGGKFRLLKRILPVFPEKIAVCHDLLAGGCNVGANVRADRIICNDIDGNLMELMRTFRTESAERINAAIEAIIKRYSLSDTFRRGYDYYGADSSDGLARVNKKAFERLRADYNKKACKSGRERSLMFYTLVVYSFNNQIRYNSRREFNIPPGKRDFNKNVRNNLYRFVKRLQAIDVSFTVNDYRDFNPDLLGPDDFVYADPPYLITCASYNESGGWTVEKELALLELLNSIAAKGVKFALSNVLRNKGRENGILLDWIKDNGYKVHHFDYDYSSSNYQTIQRNKDTDEVLVTNY